MHVLFLMQSSLLIVYRQLWLFTRTGALLARCCFSITDQTAGLAKACKSSLIFSLLLLLQLIALVLLQADFVKLRKRLKAEAGSKEGLEKQGKALQELCAKQRLQMDALTDAASQSGQLRHSILQSITVKCGARMQSGT